MDLGSGGGRYSMETVSVGLVTYRREEAGRDLGERPREGSGQESDIGTCVPGHTGGTVIGREESVRVDVLGYLIPELGVAGDVEDGGLQGDQKRHQDSRCL